MCMTRMNTFTEDETITITPMRTFPVIRDLVTDVSYNYEKARMVPAFAPPADLEPGDYRMAQVDVERSQEFRKCIECFLCNNVCHAVRDHEENKTTFSGPRFLMRIAELDMHPLDTVDRREIAVEDHGLGYCNITKCCTEVCPEHIHITDNALIPLKERVADRKYDPIFSIASLFTKNKDREAPRRRPRADRSPDETTRDRGPRSGSVDQERTSGRCRPGPQPRSERELDPPGRYAVASAARGSSAELRSPAPGSSTEAIDHVRSCMGIEGHGRGLRRTATTRCIWSSVTLGLRGPPAGADIDAHAANALESSA